MFQALIAAHLHQVDVLVPHGEVLLADAEDAGALGGGPDAEVGEGEARAVEHVAEPPHLVLLVRKQRLQHNRGINIYLPSRNIF